MYFSYFLSLSFCVYTVHAYLFLYRQYSCLSSARLLLPIVMCSYEAFSIFQVLANLINFDKNPKRRISWLLELNSKSEIECDARPIFGYSFRVVSYPLCYTRHLCDYNIRSNCEKCWWHQRHTHTNTWVESEREMGERINKRRKTVWTTNPPSSQPTS